MAEELTAGTSNSPESTKAITTWLFASAVLNSTSTSSSTFSRSNQARVEAKDFMIDEISDRPLLLVLKMRVLIIGCDVVLVVVVVGAKN